MYFANPLFLIALLAVAVPVVVHFFNFRRYKKVYFSNVDRLESLHDEVQRQSRLRQWLLLALRILAIVFLVLAFARPLWVNRNQKPLVGVTAVSVCIDNSFSLDNTNAEGPLLAAACQKAREIAAAYQPSDIFQLFTCEMEGSQFRWLSRDEFLEALDQVATAPYSPQLSQCLSRQQQFLHAAPAANRHAYLISDFQHSTADYHNFPVDTLVSTTLVLLEANDVDNLFIDSVSLNAPCYYRGSTVSIQALVRNEGSDAVEKLPVSLLVNGRQHALASVDIPAHGSASVPLRFVVEDDGVLNCCVQITDHPLTFDDKLFFSINVGTRMEVLVAGSENQYLNKLFASDSAVAYRHVSENGVDYGRLPSGLIVLNEVHSIASGMADALRRYLQEGGAVAVVPAADADIQSYNAFLSSVSAPTLASWVKGNGRVSQVQTEHPLFQGVFDGVDRTLEMPSVSARFRFNIQAQTLHQPVLTFADATPLLTSTPVGAGSLYLFASPLQPEYTDFVQQALFVPTLFNMALFSHPVAEHYYSFGTSDPILLCNTYDAADLPTISLQGTDEQWAPTLRMVGGRCFLVPGDELHEAGNYTIASASSTEGISFNYSRGESLMSFPSRSEVAEAISDRPGYSLVRNATKDLSHYIRQQAQGRPLASLCIILALACLLAEIVIILRHRKTQA